MYYKHSSLLMKTFWYWHPHFHNFDKFVKAAEVSANPFTVHFLGGVSFSFTSVSFSLSSSSAMYSYFSSNYSSVDSSGITTRSSSTSSAPTTILKIFANSTSAMLPFATSSSLANLWSYGQTSWVSSSRCHSHTPCWHHFKPKQGFDIVTDVVINPSRSASVSSQLQQ